MRIWPGRSITVTIRELREERIKFPNSSEPVIRYVLFFTGRVKGLLLNKTLSKQLATIFEDDETDHWPGHKVTLYPEAIKVAGRNYITVRAQAARPLEAQPGKVEA